MTLELYHVSAAIGADYAPHKRRNRICAPALSARPSVQRGNVCDRRVQAAISVVVLKEEARIQPPENCPSDAGILRQVGVRPDHRPDIEVLRSPAHARPTVARDAIDTQGPTAFDFLPRQSVHEGPATDAREWHFPAADGCDERVKLTRLLSHHGTA